MEFPAPTQYEADFRDTVRAPQHAGPTSDYGGCFQDLFHLAFIYTDSQRDIIARAFGQLGQKDDRGELIVQEFLYMGGKAVYVWGAYGITLLALVISLLAAARRKKSLIKEIAEEAEE